MDTKFSLKYISSITFTIKDINGKEHSFCLSSKTLTERIKSIMYQTLSYAVGFDLEKEVERIALLNIEENDLIKAIKSGEVKIETYRSYSIYGEGKGHYFYVEDRKFTFVSRKIAEEQLAIAKELSNTIKHK